MDGKAFLLALVKKVNRNGALLGLSEEMIDIATEKTQDIKAAYDLLKSQR